MKCSATVRWRLILLIAAAVLVQGCSAVRLGYGNADSLALWWIGQYLDMTPEQDALVRERISRLHGWHRRTQLPDYAALARQGQAFVAGRPTAAEALALGGEIIRRGRSLADHAAPDIAELLLTLSPGQIEYMAKRFEDKNAEHAGKIALDDGEAGRCEARYKRIVDRAEYWFGDLDREQRERLRQWIDSRPSGVHFWYDERLRRQRDWLALVRQVQRERPPRERVAAMLRDYAAGFDMPSDPARLRQAQALRHDSAELAVAIHAMTTPGQRGHARLKLEDLIGDFAALGREP